MKPFQRILMATDFSESSNPAFRLAVDLAHENKADFFVAHAYESPNLIQAAAFAPGLYEEWDANLRKEVARRLQLLVDDARGSNVTARPLVLNGNPEEAIAKAARENDVDLVVLGTRGRRGVSRLFLGSVAARVTSTAPCAVLTVKTEAPSVRLHPVVERQVSSTNAN